MQIEKIKNGEIFITTTDTVLGIGGIWDKATKKRICKIKKRDLNKPMVIMVSSLKMASTFSDWSSVEERIAKVFWPGGLTIVVNENLSLRMPNDQKLCNLINEIGPVFMTSCNKSSRSPSKNIADAKKTFSNIKIFFDTANKKITNKPSTVIFPKKNYKILRKGDNYQKIIKWVEKYE